jgi:hypothetical protein
MSAKVAACCLEASIPFAAHGLAFPRQRRRSAMMKPLCLGVAFAAMLAACPGEATAGWNPAKDIGKCFHGGCDVSYQLNKRIDDGIRSKSEAMVGPVKEAFIEAMDVLFDKKLNPMIDKINLAATARLDQVGTLISEAQTGIDEIIDHAADRANALVGQSVETIKKDIIDNTFQQADALVDKIDDSIHDIIRQIDCELLDGNVAAVDEFVSAQLKLLPGLFDGCYRVAGVGVLGPKASDWIMIYRIRQCQLEKELHKSATVAAVRDNYARLLLVTRRFKCIMIEPNAVQLLAEDSERYGLAFELWTRASK